MSVAEWIKTAAASLVHWMSGEMIYIGGNMVRIAFDWRRWAESRGAQL